MNLCLTGARGWVIIYTSCRNCYSTTTTSICLLILMVNGSLFPKPIRSTVRFFVRRTVLISHVSLVRINLNHLLQLSFEVLDVQLSNLWRSSQLSYFHLYRLSNQWFSPSNKKEQLLHRHVNLMRNYYSWLHDVNLGIANGWVIYWWEIDINWLNLLPCS